MERLVLLTFEITLFLLLTKNLVRSGEDIVKVGNEDLLSDMLVSVAGVLLERRDEMVVRLESNRRDLHSRRLLVCCNLA
jgi:hypothetical protein